MKTLLCCHWTRPVISPGFSSVNDAMIAATRNVKQASGVWAVSIFPGKTHRHPHGMHGAPETMPAKMTSNHWECHWYLATLPEKVHYSSSTSPGHSRYVSGSWTSAAVKSLKQRLRHQPIPRPAPDLPQPTAFRPSAMMIVGVFILLSPGLMNMACCHSGQLPGPPWYESTME